MNIFKCFFQRLKKRGMYSVQYGEYSGAFLIYIDEYKAGNAIAFLQIPDPKKIIFVDRQLVDHYLQSGVLKFLSTLPKDVYSVCRAEFEYLSKKENSGFVNAI